jgi:hypothetical protein
MTTTRSTMLGGLAASVFACACAAPDATPGNSSDPVYVPAGSPVIAPHAAPPAPPPMAAVPVVAVAPAPAATVAPPPAAAPVVAAPPVAKSGAAGAAPIAAVGGSAAPAAISSFDAGSGTMDPDGKTVVYHIPDGTGGKDWNPADKPIKVRHGMVLHLIDDDKSTKAGGHWLHTNGQPCPHAFVAIGKGYDCNISQNAPMGVIQGTFEHNVANGIGRIYIEVVAGAGAEQAR